jgi:hypothetical protein
MLAARIVLGLACGALMAIAAPACLAPSLDGCHQRAVDSLGCCPLCDADCRGAVAAACADDVHEPPIDDEEEETSSDSGDATDGGV